MTFGLFEQALSSEQEVGLARQASLDKRAAAIYDVREKLGPSLFASRNLQEFRDRVAMMKDDQSIYHIIGAHLHPSTGVVRSIVGRNSVIEREFKTLLASSDDDLEDRSTVTDSQKDDIKNGERADDVETNSGDGSDADGDDPDDCDDEDTYKNAARLHRADKQQYLKNQGYQTADTEDEDGVRHSGPSKSGEQYLKGYDGWRKKNEGGISGYALSNGPKKANTRLSDFDGTVDTNSTFSPSDSDLVPEDNWDGYLNSVDQNSSAVDRNFTSSVTWTVYSDWAQSQGLHPGKLATLDTYSSNLADDQYFRLARMVQAWDYNHQPKTPSGQSKNKLTDVTAARRQALVDAGLEPVDPTGSGTDGNFNSPGTLAEPFGGAGGPNSPDHGMPGEQGGRLSYLFTAGPTDPVDPTGSGTDGNFNTPGTVAEPFGGAGGPNSPDHGMPGEQGGRLGRQDPVKAYIAWCNRNGYQRLSARNVQIFAGGDPQLCVQLAYRVRRAMRTAWWRQGGDVTEENMPDFGAADPISGVSSGPPSDWSFSGQDLPGTRPTYGSVRYTMGRRQASARLAAPDYLQKADDALTQLLNQKAEEFQQTIQPLQQALVTVQQAEQLQQAQNPLNVLPPPGTVNVMPGGDQGPAGMPAPGAQDLGGAAQALAGGAPPGGDPGAAGGAPGGGMPDQGPPPAAGDPNQGGLPPELQQMMGRKRGGSGKGRGATRPQASNRTANDVHSLWEKFQNSGATLRGDDSDYEAFASQFGLGQRAINKLKQKNGLMPTARNAQQRYRRWCAHNQLKAASSKNYYWYLAQVSPTERVLLTGDKHDYNKGDEDQIFAPAKGFGWEHKSGPSGPPYVRDQADKGKHEASRKQAWSGWGPSVFPKTRQVTGWNWNNHLNGYESQRPQHFACACGDSFPAPSGFHRCACGRQWNSYVIGNGGSTHEASADKFLVREIPVRPDVIVANRQLTAKTPILLDDKWAQNDQGGWNHPDGGQVRPSAEHEGQWQLFGPTVAFGGRGGKLAPMKQPHDNPHTLMNWYSWASGEGPKPKGTGFFGSRDVSEAAERNLGRYEAQLIDPKTGQIHTLIDPGEIGEGQDDGMPTMKKPPADWAHRGDGARWQGSPIGKA